MEKNQELKDDIIKIMNKIKDLLETDAKSTLKDKFQNDKKAISNIEKELINNQIDKNSIYADLAYLKDRTIENNNYYTNTTDFLKYVNKDLKSTQNLINQSDLK